MSLHDAVRNGNAAEVKTLIASGSNVNQVDKLKRTPLHMAAWSGNKDIIQILIRSNANTTDKAADAFTPLHFVAQSQSLEAADCVRVLIKANKSLLHQRISKGNKSALHLAAIKGNESVILTLIELGADVNATTSSGQTYLDLIKSEDLKSEITKKVVEMRSAKSDKSRDKSDKSNKSEDDVEDEEVKIESIIGAKRSIEDVVNESDANKH